MIYKVVKLRTNGKRNPREESIQAEGVLGEDVISIDSRSGEPVKYAELLDRINPSSPGRIIYRLQHPEILNMTSKRMLIRGIELSDESEVVQEWWCKQT
jgi:hypothetical protein